MKQLLITLSLLCLLSHIYSQATIPCTFKDPSNGYDYDLNDLVDNTNDYVVEVQANTDNQTAQAYKISLNICRPIINQACSQQAGTTCDACQQWPLDSPKFSNSLGKTGNTNFMTAQDPSGQDKEGVTMYFGGFTSTMSINFVCDTGAGKGHPTYVTKPATNSFLLKWKSKYACATNGKATSDSGSSGGLSGGSIMMIIVLVVVVVYVAAGVAWQKFKNNAAGTDLIPNKEFWVSLPGLVKDGILFIVGKIRGGGSSYQKF